MKKWFIDEELSENLQTLDNAKKDPNMIFDAIDDSPEKIFFLKRV